jgi:GxxExxY protein
MAPFSGTPAKSLAREIELKAVKDFDPIHESQLLTYMRITACKVGLLINFNKPTLINGVKRFVI